MHFNLPNSRVKVLTLTYCHDTLATILLPWRFGNLTLPNQLLRPVLSTTQQDEFRTGLKSCETACLPTQNVSQNPYPTWLGDQNRWAKHVWYPGSLATCHNHNQLLRPVGQVTIWWVQKWSQNMCTLIFSYPKSGSKCLRKVHNFLLPPQKARVARVPRIKCSPCFRAGAIHDIYSWIAPARGCQGSQDSPDFAEKLTRGVKIPIFF